MYINRSIEKIIKLLQLYKIIDDHSRLLLLFLISSFYIDKIDFPSSNKIKPNYIQ